MKYWIITYSLVGYGDLTTVITTTEPGRYFTNMMLHHRGHRPIIHMAVETTKEAFNEYQRLKT